MSSGTPTPGRVGTLRRMNVKRKIPESRQQQQEPCAKSAREPRDMEVGCVAEVAEMHEEHEWTNHGTTLMPKTLLPLRTSLLLIVQNRVQKMNPVGSPWTLIQWKHLPATLSISLIVTIWCLLSILSKHCGSRPPHQGQGCVLNDARRKKMLSQQI